MHWNYSDGFLKGAVLNAVLTGRTTSNSIFDIIKYPGKKDCFYAELCMLKKRGYLTQHKLYGVSIYGLTSKGVRHAKDPFLYLRYRQKRANDLVNALLTKDPKFSDAHKRLCLSCDKDKPFNILRPVQNTIENSQTDVGKSSPTNPNFGTFWEPVFATDTKPDSILKLGRDEYLKIIVEQDKRIKDLEADCVNKDIVADNLANRIARNHEQSVKVVPYRDVEYRNPKTGSIIPKEHVNPEYIRHKEAQRVRNVEYSNNIANRRWSLVRSFLGKFLTLDFLQKYGNFRAWYDHNGYVVIGSESYLATEKAALHFKRYLTANEFMRGQYHFVDITDTGFYISGANMVEMKYMRPSS
ncbi:MAG: hypothetical protein Q8P40_05025 [Nitrospirota bacterium]|nr:hypothetical protein [Nitrospirota bacterium]